MRILSVLRTISSVALISLFVFTSTIGVTSARSVSDISAEIGKKQSELVGLEDDLEAAEEKLADTRNSYSSALSEVEKIQAEIDELDAQIEVIELKQKKLVEELNLAELEKEELEAKQDLQVEIAYRSWKSGDQTNSWFGGADMVKASIYHEEINTKSFGGIQELETRLGELESKNANFNEDKSELQAEIAGIAERKKQAEQKLASAQSAVAGAQTSVKGIRSQQSQLQSQIEQLTKEQQELIALENNVVEQNPGAGGSGATKELQSGEYYFSGTGRDLYQGHGVGMSQFGALGANINNGWGYKKILEFYFPGAKVAKASLPSTINVDGVGSVPMEDYVAGLGEVPDKACEDIGVDFDINNMWYCWPREVIKAQVVAARSYAARRAGFIYADTRSQVYKGGKAKKWAADATKGEVVLYGGAIADTYYSSDNNQGNGNANNDTVWSNFSGNGTAIPYLRSVNDNSFAIRTKWSKWGWRSNSYKIDEIDSMFNWAKSTGSLSSSARSFMSNLKPQVGKVESLSFERDPSSRVNKVVVTGSKGTTKMAGWLFKSVWNIWVGTVKPSGEADYIYSLTFFLNKK